jgi:hypothetical protein
MLYFHSIRGTRLFFVFVCDCLRMGRTALQGAVAGAGLCVQTGLLTPCTSSAFPSLWQKHVNPHGYVCVCCHMSFSCLPYVLSPGCRLCIGCGTNAHAGQVGHAGLRLGLSLRQKLVLRQRQRLGLETERAHTAVVIWRTAVANTTNHGWRLAAPTGATATAGMGGRAGVCISYTLYVCF